MASLTLPFRAHGGNPQPHPSTSRISSHGSQEQSHKFSIRTYVVNRYQTCDLGSRLWGCKICGRRASHLHHSAISFLSPCGSSSVDMIIPTCKSTSCYSEASDRAHDFGKYGKPNRYATECENCGSKSGVKLCGGSTFSCKHVLSSTLCLLRTGIDWECLISGAARSTSSQGTRRRARQRHRQSTAEHDSRKVEVTEHQE